MRSCGNRVFCLMVGVVCLAAAAGQALGAGIAPDIKDAIVKIYTIHSPPDYYNPWSMQGPQGSTGSGCIISGRKILTNGHVVGDQTFVQVRRYGDARKYQATVLNVSHDADVALLTVEDPEFFEGVAPLEFGELPEAQQEVVVYGFPLGGDTLSTTKGVISRIEHQTYAHSSAYLLAAQIDAAVNPGNSGGPALVDGRVVGVAMQTISQAENIGYIVPVPVIRHFLKDIEDGRYDGFPSLGVLMQQLENADLKRKYGVPEDRTGMLIFRVVPGSSAQGQLEPGDVLLSIAGHAVADDGTVEFRPRERTSCAYYIQERQIGEAVEVEVLRGGEVRTMTVLLGRSLIEDRLMPMERYDVLPTYYIFGGVVFCPLTKDLLQAWGPNWYNNAPKELVARLGDNFVKEDQDEIVLALKVLAADINEGYHEYANWMIEEVNGRKLRNLKELVAIVEAEDDSPFVTFTNDRGEQIVLDRARAAQARDRILKTYRIRSDRSPDLGGL